MRAVGLFTHGGPEVLQVVELPEVHAGPGQVRIRVHAASSSLWPWPSSRSRYPVVRLRSIAQPQGARPQLWSLIATGAETIASIATTWYGIFIMGALVKIARAKRFIPRKARLTVLDRRAAPCDRALAEGQLAAFPAIIGGPKSPWTNGPCRIEPFHSARRHGGFLANKSTSLSEPVFIARRSLRRSAACVLVSSRGCAVHAVDVSNRIVKAL